MAQRVAELVGGGDHGKSALEGLTLALLANAQRVANDMDEAKRDSEAALARWSAAEEAERATLPGWRLLDLEASLYRDLRQFPRALDLLAMALVAAPPEDHSRILVKKAVTLEHMGDAEEAIEVLQDAAPHAGADREPRLLLKIHFNLGANLCHLERYGDAEALLPKIQELAAYDYALASLERAEVDLREGRYAEVRALTEEMKWIFKAKGIHREALAAVRLFREAAAREQATPELAHRVVRYLYRAQHDPDLRFAA